MEDIQEPTSLSWNNIKYGDFFQKYKLQACKAAVYIYDDISAVTGRSSWNNAFSVLVKDLPWLLATAHEITEMLSFENYI